MEAISYQDEVEQAIFRRRSGRLLIAAAIYREDLAQVPEFTYYKALERMVERRKLLRVSKGVYVRPDRLLGESEIREEVIRYYTGTKGRFSFGFCGGSRLAEKYRLFGEDGVCTAREIVYTARISERRRMIQGITLFRYPQLLDEKQVFYAEVLELVAGYEWYSAQPGFEAEAFTKVVREMAADYDDGQMVRQIGLKQYQKRTIAFLEQLLALQGCETTLKRFLPGTSKYRLPKL